ncbi:MAG: enoyl-CoA hydratase/isomerase family protein [Candidatus Binatia bacterium]
MSRAATIGVERDGPVLIVTLDRPEVLNAYSMAMRDDLFGAFSLARDDDSIRAVVVRGNGRAFCSGGDLAEFGAAPSPVVAREVRWKRDVWGLLRSLPQPTIAAVHGHATGSGMEMALLCDFRIAATDAVFSLPETALGLIPGVVGTQTAPRAIGLARALELVLAERRIDAFEAFRIGLVGSVVRPNRLRGEADRLARRLSEIDGGIAAKVTGLVRRALERTEETGLVRERIVAATLRRESK